MKVKKKTVAPVNQESLALQIRQVIQEKINSLQVTIANLILNSRSSVLRKKKKKTRLLSKKVNLRCLSCSIQDFPVLMSSQL